MCMHGRRGHDETPTFGRIFSLDKPASPRDCDCDFYCVGLWLCAPRCCWSRTRRHDRLRTVIILITYSWPWRYDTTQSRGRERVATRGANQGASLPQAITHVWKGILPLWCNDHYFHHRSTERAHTHSIKRDRPWILPGPRAIISRMLFHAPHSTGLLADGHGRISPAPNAAGESRKCSK